MLPSRNPGTQLQAPPPGSPPAFQAPLPQSQASPQSRCRQACRNQAGRGPKGIYCRSVLRSQGHLALFTFWSIGCLHRTRRTRKLMANCKWPKAGTPKLRYRKPPRVGPMVRVSGCIEAQRPSMVPVGGRGVSQARAGSWGPPPRLPRSRAQRGLRCVPDPPRPGPAGRLPVATPVLLPSPSTKGPGNRREHRPGPVLWGRQGAGDDIPAGRRRGDGPGGERSYWVTAVRAGVRGGPRRPHWHPYSPKQPPRNWKERTPRAVEGLRGARRAPHVPLCPRFPGSPSCLHPGYLIPRLRAPLVGCAFVGERVVAATANMDNACPEPPAPPPPPPAPGASEPRSLEPESLAGVAPPGRRAQRGSVRAGLAHHPHALQTPGAISTPSAVWFPGWGWEPS